MRRSEPGLIVLVTLALAIAACSCTAGGDDAGTDAALDARDAGDTGRDAPDAPRDTPRDVPEIVVPGFVRVGADVLPTDCDLRMATDPMTTHGGPLTFVPCPDRTGCRQIDVSWTSFTSPTFQVGRFQSEHDGVHGRFAYTRLAPDSTDDFVDWNIIANDAGEIEAIIRSPRLQCQAGWPAISDGRYATIVYHRSRRAERLGDYIVGGELSDPVGTFRVLAFLDPVSTPVPAQDIYVDSSGVAVGLAGANTIVRVGWDGSVQRVASPATEGGASAELDFIRDDHVVFTAVGSSIEVRTLVGTGASVSLLPSSPAGEPGMANADGTHLVWMNGIGRTGGRMFERMELWTSPFCLEASCVTATHVAEIPEAGSFRELVVGHGMVAVATTANQFRFFDLETMASYDVDLPTGRRWQTLPRFIGPDEFAIVPATDRFPDSPPEAETVMFIRRDSL